MAIDLYVPYKLESELERFKQNKGNINFDYRSNTVSAPHVLDTSYISLNEITNPLVADIAPFVVPSSHVSGDVSNYRNLTLDVLVYNSNNYQCNVIVLNTLKDVVRVFYSKTTAVKVGANNTLVHTFNLLDPLETISGQLTPIYFRSVRELTGVVDKKLCELLYLDTFPSIISVSVVDSVITVVQSSSVNNGHNVVLDPKLVSNTVKQTTLFYKDNLDNKSTSKLRIVSGIDSTLDTINPNPLSDLIPNYNLYYNNVGDIVPNPDGVCFSLKAKESVLINSLIQTNLDSYESITELGDSFLTVSEGFTGGLSSYFASIKFELPSTIPTNEFAESIPIYLRIDGIVTTLPSYVDSEFNLLYSSIKSVLEPKGVKVYERSDYTLFFYNTSDLDIEIVLGYKNVLLTTKEDVSKVGSIYGQPNLTFTEVGYPTNVSLSYGEDLDLPDVIIPEDVDLTFFTFNLTSNIDKTPIDGLFNFTKYSVDIPSLKLGLKTLMIEEDGIEYEFIFNFVGTIKTDAQIMLDIKTLLLEKLLKMSAEIEDNYITLKNSLNTFLPITIESSVITLDEEYSGIYEKINNKDSYYLSRVS